MRYFNHAGAHALETSQYCKKQFWAGQFLVECQTNQNEPQHISDKRENNLEHSLNRFWEVEPVEQSTMTVEQQACEEHFLTHTHT